jgi:hypothetical protein
MSQLTSEAPPATANGAAAVTSSAPCSPDPYGRLRIWARLHQAVQEITCTPGCPGELHIRWP